MILTTEELIELTGRRRSDAQVRVLRFMGIEHRRRPDGSIAVSRAHVNAMLGATIVRVKEKEYKLDVSAIR